MPSVPENSYVSPFTRLSRLLRIFVALLLAFYLLDASWFYLRRSYPQSGLASGSIHRRRVLAISDKGGKTEYTIDAVQPEEDIPCVHSLFPHATQKPCWYVARHANDPIPI
jgi:hypothetical protein